MDQPQAPKMSVSRGALLSVATNSAFRWSPIGEVTESFSLNSRSMDEFYPELRVHLERPSETVDCAAGRTFDCSNCVASPQSRSPTGRNAFTTNGCNKQDKVKVYVRMRPFSESEKVCPLKHVLCLIGETIVVRDLDQKLTGISKEPPHKAEAIEFKVDYMQDDSYLQVHSTIHKEESQKRMYGALGVPCIESALDGYNTTILAYGQTGSGKTYTMMGDNTKAGRGLIPRLANDLMTKIREESSNGVLYTVQVSYLEIYQEKIRDLLAEDDIEEEAKPPAVPQPSSDLNGMNSNDKVRAPGSNPEVKFHISGQNVEEKVRNLEQRMISSYTGSLTENSYTSSFLNKAALQRQLEASQKPIRLKSDAEKSPIEKPHSSSSHDGAENKVRSPKTKPAFDTVFSKQKVHKHYRTFPTVMEEPALVKKQHFLKIREHPITGPFVEGLLWKDVYNWYDMENLMKQGSTSRTTAATDMNEQSSRSHAVFSIRLTKKLGPDLFGVQPTSLSYINLVDLAGSEKLPKLCSGAVTGQRTLEESRCINRSLSQLNEVILSLSKSSFVSYRNSVLTWLLKESLGGNSRTFMVANISPTEKDLRESINTLRYATTASRIPPPVALDQDPRNKLIKKLKEEISTLRTLLSSFTSVKEIPSNQLPSLQGFKVPCLDVGLQVEENRSHDDCSLGKELDKESQTENHFRDVGQQTTSRSESVEAGFQIELNDGAALDMGNPTVLQDSGRVDIGHQTLILNVCTCDFGHQASPNDFGMLEVTVSQHSMSDCGAKDACVQRIPQGSVYLRHQAPLRDCGAVDVENQIGLRDCCYRNAGNQSPIQGRGDADAWNQITWPNGWGLDDKIQNTLQSQRDVVAGSEMALPDLEDFNATNQNTMQNNRESDGWNPTTWRNWGPVDAGNQTKSRNWGPVDAGNLITSRNWGPIDTGNQVTLRGWGDVDAGNQITLRNWGDVNAESQISLKDFGLVDVELQTACRDLGASDAGNQITMRDWGAIDAAHQTNPADCGSKDASHQTRLQDHGANKATECTRVQLDVSHQINWRAVGASDALLQVTPQKPVTKDSGYEVSWVDLAATDSRDQINWREFGSSDVGNQVTADDPGEDGHQDSNSKDCKVVDHELQVDSRSFKLFDFGQQKSLTEVCNNVVAHQANMNDDNEGVLRDPQFHRIYDGSFKAQHHKHPNVREGNNLRPWMTLGHSDAVGSGHEAAPRPSRHVGGTHKITGSGSDGGHEIEPKDLSMTDIELQTAHDHGGVVDAVQQTDEVILSTSDFQLQASQAEFGTSDAGNKFIKISNVPQHNVMLRDFKTTADPDFPVWLYDAGDLRPGTDISHAVLQNCRAENVGQQTAGKKLGTTDQQVSLHPSPHPSTTDDNTSPMNSNESSGRDTVNPNNTDGNSNGAVEFGHPSIRTNSGAFVTSDEASLRVGRVEKIKEQFERRTSSPVQFGHQKSPWSSNCASPRDGRAIRIGHQTSLEVEDGEDKKSPTESKYLIVDVGHSSTLQDCGSDTDAELQTNFDASLQTRGNKIGVKAPQRHRRDEIGVEFGFQAAFEDSLSTLRHKRTSTDFDRNSLDKYRAVEEVGCQASFEDYLSTLRHKSTSTDFDSHDVDRNGLDKYRALKAWKRFQCGVCAATPGNSMVIVSTMVPIQEVAADVGMKTSWVDFFATASELQTTTTGWGVSSDVYPMTPKALESVDESRQVGLEDLHPFHEQHWNHFGTSGFRRQPLSKASKSLDLAELQERRPSADHTDVQVGPHSHWEKCEGCNSRCEDCDQDYVVQKWQQQHHKIMLSEPCYLVTESDPETSNTHEETRSWNASLGRRHQNPHVYLDDVSGLESLPDVKSKLRRPTNAELQQCSDCCTADFDVQARDFPIVLGEKQQQQSGGAVSASFLALIMRSIEERVSAENQALKNGDDEEATSGIPRTQTIQKGRSGASDFSQQTHLQSYRIGVPAERLEPPGDNESGQLRSEQYSVCLCWLRDITGEQKKSGNVPAEEAFHLCSCWTLAKLRSRIKWYSIDSERNCLKYRFSLATKCLGLVSQRPLFSKVETATQTDSSPEDSPNHNTNLSNTLQQICLLWVFVILRIAAPVNEKWFLTKDGKRQVGKKPPYVGVTGLRKTRILSSLSDSAIDERRFMSRGEYCRPSKLRHLRYSGVEPLTFKSTTPFFIQTSGDCSLVKTPRVDRSPPRSGNTAGGSRHYKIMCGFPSRRVVYFLKEGVNRLGSNRGAHIVVNGLSEDHGEFIYMPAHRCAQKKGYVVARLVAPGAMAFLNGLPMLEHKELCTGDVLVLRDLRYRSSVCTLHFFDPAKFSSR